MTNKDFLRRFDAHEKFTKGEIKEMCWGEVGKVLEKTLLILINGLLIRN